MQDNVFTTHLFDIIMPELDFPELDLGDFDDEASYMFLILEFIQTDLKSVLKQHSDLEFSQDHVITIMYNLLCAMNFLHTSNILHRDIKPANILIDEECRPKICDFGISRTRMEDSIYPAIQKTPKTATVQK